MNSRGPAGGRARNVRAWRVVALTAGIVLLMACKPQAPASQGDSASAPASAPAPAATQVVVAYVPNQKSGTISVIDTSTDRVVRTLSGGDGLGKRLQQIALTPDRNQLYVVDAEGHRLLLLDIASDTVQRSVDIGQGAEGVGVSPDGRQLVVCIEGQNQVMFIEAATFALGAHVDVQGKAPEHCVWTPDGKSVLTSNEASDTIDVIDVASAR
jgi:YVTN family beta-propeller protein